MIVDTNKDLFGLNTFKVNCVAQKYIQIDDYNDLYSSSFQNELSGSFHIIGSGSNILFVSKRLDVIIKINIKGIEVKENADHILIKVAAGELLDDFVKFCVKNNYGGIENLALIPGTVGAAPIQNVGAYGAEIKDIFYQLEALNTKTLKMETFGLSECKFNYRNSIFKELKSLYIVSSVSFKLYRNYEPKIIYKGVKEYLDNNCIKNPSIKQIYDAVSFIRRNKLPDPDVIPNAGSFFKNPVINKDKLYKLKEKYHELYYTQFGEGFKLNAAQLIELSKLKNIEINHIATWYKQPLIIINKGNCSGKDIFDFSEYIISSVYKNFGIILEREVNVL